MRFHIEFNRLGRQKMLPVDYQYYIGAWIYHILGTADRAFAEFLHTQGYRDGQKQFKLFNYSPLDFGKKVLWKEKNLFEITEDRLTLGVSFQVTDAAETFILGLFRNRQVYLGDSFNRLDLSVAQIERLPDTEPAETMRYRALSPIVLSYQYPGWSYASYLSPEDEDYARLLNNHFRNKYQAIPNAAPLPDSFPFCFTLTGIPRSKLVTIKQGTPEQSKIRGYLFDFELTAPPEIHRMMLSCGAGEKNSLGFGWCEEGGRMEM